MSGWNIFRILGDLSHISSKAILILAIHRNRSAEGVSMITQILYAIVFCSRYMDLFSEIYAWNVFFKIFYILSSFYIIVIMRYLYPRTREREMAWKLGGASLGGSLILSPFMMMIFEEHWTFFNWARDFSKILEALCILPQLLLLRQTTVPTVIDSYYLLTLGAYRGLYLFNWIWRALDQTDVAPNGVSVIFGIIQTALYVDFFWVYYTRQRVKLRNGGVVDADDIRRGWLLNRIFGKRFDAEHVDEESAPALGGDGGATNSSRRSKWGARGISVSADDGTYEHEAGLSQEEGVTDGVDPDAKMRDPDELARVLDDDEDDDDGTLPSGSNDPPKGVNNGNEWRD